MAKCNYEKLIELNPMSFGKVTNKEGREIEFLEHPTKGGEAEIICVCHELKIAQDSGFFETDDMETEEYIPSFVDGQLFIGELKSLKL